MRTAVDEIRTEAWRTMSGWVKGMRLSPAALARICADAIIVNLSLLMSLSLAVLAADPVLAPAAILARASAAYGDLALPLTLICTIVFFASGLYTYGRSYRWRHKVRLIARAVTLAYLIFGSLLLLRGDPIGATREALVLSWLLTLTLATGVRIRRLLWPSIEKDQYRLLVAGMKDGINSVLVIGGAGYIGSALVRRLLELEYRVRVLDLLLYGDEAIAEFQGNPRFELVKGDLRHIGTVVNAIRGMDAVVDLGAIVGDSACSVCEELTVEVNLQATRTIADIAKGFGVKRFVYASTCSVYGASDETLDEHSSLCPLSLYARTKVDSENVLHNLSDATFAPVILRFGTIYGLSGRTRFDLVVNLLTAKAVQDKEVGIFGGQQWRPLVHVRDVAEAIVLALCAPSQLVCGETFNVGSNDQNYQIADLGPIIKEMVPDTAVVTQPQEDNRNYRVRFDKIQNTLHFQPHYTVRDGVAEIIAAFDSGAIKDYRDPRYSNSAFLKQHSELQRTLLEEGWMREWEGLVALQNRDPSVAA